MKLIDAIINNPVESRKTYLLNKFEEEGKKSSSNNKFKFWEHENHPVLLDTTKIFDQKINYLHWNPVSAGFVTEPWHWLYSSAVDFFTDKKGLLDIIKLDGFRYSNKKIIYRA